ncbi:dihydropteroate synthase [Streptomyces himalayensis]|uniref:dihydropteroate synthase n=1 Tax=Streptomyces himalayensis TaxID=2820085 RepID=UPI00406BC472
MNVAPDSFSDGVLSFAADAAVAHGLALLEQGADLVDVGGESALPRLRPGGADPHLASPGAARPPVEGELRHVLPVVRELAAAGAIVTG